MNLKFGGSKDWQSSIVRENYISFFNISQKVSKMAQEFVFEAAIGNYYHYQPSGFAGNNLR